MSTEQEFVNLILDDIKSASSHYEKLTNGGDISFFDLDVEPYKNGISYSCILDTDADEEKAKVAIEDALKGKEDPKKDDKGDKGKDKKDDEGKKEEGKTEDGCGSQKDTAEVVAACHEIQDIAWQECPMFPAFGRTEGYAYTKGLEGVVLYPSGNISFRNATFNG